LQAAKAESGIKRPGRIVDWINDDDRHRHRFCSRHGLLYGVGEQDSAKTTSSKIAVNGQSPDESGGDRVTGQPLRHFGREVGRDYPRRTEREEARDAPRFFGHNGDENARDAAACVLCGLRSDVSVKALVSAVESRPVVTRAKRLDANRVVR